MDPVKRESKLRGGLTYLTVFFVATVLLGDAVDLIYSLSGELTTRLDLKVLTVAFMAGGTCGFFLSDLTRDEAEA